MSSSNALAAFDWLMDVPSPVEVVLGTTSMSVAECSRLGVESVVRLRQPAGADLEVRVGGLPFAYGEVVIADDNVTLRLGRIAPPASENPS